MTDHTPPRASDASPGRRMTKGDWTFVICVLLMLSAVPAHFLGLLWLKAACVYIGSAALIGAFTNRIAIDALFDPWPSRRFSLPYTGIIEIERRRIEQAIMTAVAERLITPEVLAEELRESSHLDRLRDEAAKAVRSYAQHPIVDPNDPSTTRMADTVLLYSREALHRAILNDDLVAALASRLQSVVEAVLESDECYDLVKQRFIRLSGKVGRLGHVTGIADYDDVTYRVLDGLKNELAELWDSPDKMRNLVAPWLDSAAQAVGDSAPLERELKGFMAAELSLALERAANRLEAWDIGSSNAVEQFIGQAVQKFDVKQVVGRALGKLSTEEVKLLVQKHSREHLDWLEVWGGVLGAVGGALLWAVSPWLVQ